MRLIRMSWALVAAVAVVGLTAHPAAAGMPISVPEPSTLGLLSSAVTAGIVGYRWFRRR